MEKVKEEFEEFETKRLAIETGTSIEILKQTEKNSTKKSRQKKKKQK